MWSTIVRGAIAGVVASWVMGKVTTYLYEHQDEEATEREEEARGGETAYVTAARKAAGLVGVDLDEEGSAKAGQALSWGLAMDAGVTYALLRPYLPGSGAWRGLGYGIGFFTLMDELTVPALKLTPGPTAFPWQTHARGLAGHLAYGLTAEAVLQALGERDRPRDGRPFRIAI